jgi:hypothetical protein
VNRRIVGRAGRPRTFLVPLVAAALLASGLAACSGSLTDSRERVVGTIDTIGDDSPLVAYRSADGIVVEVTTFGNGCYTKGETDARVQDGRWIVTPYDYRNARRNVNCPDIGRLFHHRVVLQGAIDGVGLIWIRAHGATGGPVVEFEVPVSSGT